ncbi:MAG: ribonuclease H-like domain-containing protein [Thermoplasmata archaeon]|nr:ribonuclease H-like domain-containing protein [Thermoplasmata archaeon]
MLFSSFIFLDGIGVAREQRLWSVGISSWNLFLESQRIPGMSDIRKGKADAVLGEARARLKMGDAEHFAALLDTKDHWRCYDEFKNKAIYLDIETTGTSSRAPITVVGMYDGKRMHSLVRGQNLTDENLRAILEQAGMIVTFNGASFDLPVIEHAFPGAVPKVPHLDLKHLLRRLGRAGGLKMIEREMGIERDLRIQYLTGQDAVYLWRLWQKRGAWNALETLKEYNTEDCVNLKTIAGTACAEMTARLMGPTQVAAIH